MLTGESSLRGEDGGTRWLSGAIVTPLNMFVFPLLWFALILVALVYSTVNTGHLPNLRKLGFYGVWLLAVTVFVGWVSSRTRRVGIEPGRLVVSTYFREIRVPFGQIEAVESVWWYWRRLVRVRFTGPSGFSEAVYYIPPWASIRFWYRDPVQELRQLISRDRLETFGHE
jgi:hypothetical protein